MCGLAGVLLFPTERSEADWQAIRHLFTQMLVFNDERGREAAGAALIQGDGNLSLFKQPVPASELVDMPLCVHYHALWQALCFSSRYFFLREAFGHAAIAEALPSRRTYLFDAARLPELGKQPSGELPLCCGEPPRN